MRFDVVTLFPQMFAPFLTLGVSGRAFQGRLAVAEFWNPRDIAVISIARWMTDLLAAARHGAKTRSFGRRLARRPKRKKSAKIIYLTPRGAFV